MSKLQIRLSGRISRRDLAKNRRVWLTYALMFGIVAVATAWIPLLWPNTFEATRLWPFAAALAAVAITAAFRQPPPIGGLANHAVILSVPVFTALGVIAFSPSGVVAVPAAIFSGAFTAGRLQRRSELVAHYLIGGLILASPVLVTAVDDTTRLAIAGMIPAVWVLGLCAVLVLEAAERQGEELAQLVLRDPLTGVGNRRLLAERLEHEIALHARTGRPFSVLAFDLNGFKALNDLVGHDAGDAVLRRVAATLQATVGPADTVVRQGGDEFCVLLPEATAARAETVCAAVVTALLDLREDTVPITTGTGIATFPADGNAAEDLLSVADSRLGTNKANARLARASEVAARPTGADAIEQPPKPPALSPAATPPTRSTRVSRQDIAVSRVVWLANGIMLAFFAVVCGALIVAAPSSMPPGAIPLCAAVGAIGLAMLLSEPPRIGTAMNHVVVAVPYVASLLAIVVMPEFAGAAMSAFAFTGPLTATRLVDRRQIAAHYLLATAGVAGLIAAGIVGPAVSLALVLMILCMWGSGFSDLVYLEASEEQGAELERLVRRDPLTGAGNRRLLAEQLDLEFRRHTRTRRPLTVLALDLNGFKQLNDAVGHAAGDELLRDVAAALRAVVGPEDTVVRQGGDEFCVLLPETSSEQAVPIANAIRAAIESIGAHGHPISTGVGAATFPTDAVSASVMFHVADTRLRHDKLLAVAPRASKVPAPDVPALRLYG